MKYYKNIKQFIKKAEGEANPSKIWDYEGIRVKGKRFFIDKYGGLSNNSYIVFRNLGRKGRHKHNQTPIKKTDSFITLYYSLDAENSFKFVNINYELDLE